MQFPIKSFRDLQEGVRVICVYNSLIGMTGTIVREPKNEFDSFDVKWDGFCSSHKWIKWTSFQLIVEPI